MLRYKIVEQTLWGTTYVYVISESAPTVGPLTLATKTFVAKTERGLKRARANAKKFVEHAK